MKKLIVILTLLLGTEQYAQELPNVIPPSPEAQAFQKYGDIPVSTYTGVPNISIPMYTITEGDISVPISVSYHASGIKVAEEASRVGLGWALNVGGMISRTVVGADDFGQINSYHNGGIPELNMGSHNIFTTFPVQQANQIDVYNNSPLNLDPNITDSQGEVYDLEPDQYSYNFLGHSGKFILTPNKTVVLEKKEKIEITCMDANADTWEIRTPDGMQYYFEIFDAYLEETLFIKSTWFLTKIISPKGNQVDFYYEDLGNQYIRPLGSYQEIDNSQFAINGGPCDGSKASIDQAVPGKEYTQLRLDYISFDLGEVKFNYGTRDDLEGDTKLESIEVFKKINGVKEASPFKGFQFGYEYFETLYNGNFNNSSYSKKRLKLTSLTEAGYIAGVETLLSPYKFEYEQNVKLPAKTSFSRDHWGYYNGKANSSLIPEFTAVQGDLTAQGLIGVMGTERDADANYMVAGSLKEITYPTGGSTEFFFEAHDYDATNSNIDPYFHSQPYIEKNLAVAYDTKGTISEGWIDLTDMYEIDETGLVAPTSFTVKFRASQSCGSQGSTFGNDISYFELYKADGTFVHRISIGSSNTLCDGGVFYNYFDEAGQNQINLDPGMYKWVAYIPNNGFGGDGLEDIHATYKYKAIKLPEANGAKYYYAGGLRVQKIVSKDNVDPNNDQTKTYKYNYREDVNGDGIDEEYSHGILKAYPRYCYFEPRRIGGCNVTYLVRSSSSTIPLYANPVGYSEVTVVQEGNGKTIFNYLNGPNTNLYYDFGSFAYNVAVPARPPFKPVKENPFAGLLEKRTDFREENGSFSKIRELQNNYDILGAHNFYNLYYGIEIRRHTAGQVWSSEHDVAYIYPAILSNFINMTESKEWIYDSDDVNKFVYSNTIYDYDYDTHLQLSTKTVTDSKGREIRTTYRYPDEVSDISALGGPDLSTTAKSAIDKLKEDQPLTSRIGQVVQTETTVSENSTVLSSTLSRTDFSDAWSNNLILPQFVKSLKDSYSATNDLEDRITFHSYDDYGNPTEFSKTGGAKTAYIWGYSKEYPIAKIENASYSDIATALGITEGDLDNYDESDMSNIDGLRTSLSKAMVSTYTYEPLVGVTSMTDPRGYTITYEYDEFSRLKVVKDAEGNLVTDYEYHYKGQTAGN